MTVTFKNAISDWNLADLLRDATTDIVVWGDMPAAILSGVAAYKKQT